MVNITVAIMHKSARVSQTNSSALVENQRKRTTVIASGSLDDEIRVQTDEQEKKRQNDQCAVDAVDGRPLVDRVNEVGRDAWRRWPGCHIFFFRNGLSRSRHHTMLHGKWRLAM